MSMRTALVIEDNRVISLVFSMALQEAGFDTITLRDGQAVMEYLEEGRPELVVLDLNLPGVTGRAILPFIRQHERLVQSKVIIVSADSIQATYLSSQADVALIKPVGFHQLRQLSMQLFSEREQAVGSNHSSIMKASP
jgi:DNA-binding response OmpR family regulator